MKRKIRKVVASLLIVCICFNTINLKTLAEEMLRTEIEDMNVSVSNGDAIINCKNGNWDGKTIESVFDGDGFKVTFLLSGHWNGGYTANVVIENTGIFTIENWKLGFDCESVISDIWNAVICSQDDKGYIVKNSEWNQDIQSGGKVEFGFCVNDDFRGFPKEYCLLGDKMVAGEEDYAVEYYLDSDWDNGFTGKIVITNNTDEVLEDWILEFDFERNITSIWDAEIVEHNGYHYVVKNRGYNSNISSGQSVCFGFIGEGG